MTGLQNLIQLRADKEYKLTIYEGTYRGRRYIGEISATLKEGASLRGISYMSGEIRQRTLQKWADTLLAEGIATHNII